MRPVLLATISIVLFVLAACQTESENDPPVINPADCSQHELDTGVCTK
jgi:hypothetical protein